MIYKLPRTFAAPAKVTVAITTYPKYHQYLQLALASIDFAHTEVLVINDSCDIPIKVQGKHVTVINRTESKPWYAGRARNIAWQHCTTDNIIFLDGDDVFFPGAIEAMHWYQNDIFERTGERHIIYGNLIRTDMNKVWQVNKQYRGTDVNSSPVFAANSVMPYLCLIPVKVLEQIGGYVTDDYIPTWEDLVFEADLWLHSIKATRINIITYIYRWSTDGRRGSNDTSDIRAAVQAFMYDRYKRSKR